MKGIKALHRRPLQLANARDQNAACLRSPEDVSIHKHQSYFVARKSSLLELSLSLSLSLSLPLSLSFSLSVCPFLSVLLQQFPSANGS